MFHSMFNKLLVILAIALFGTIFIPPASAATQTFQWQGARGYFVKGRFEYEEQPQPIRQRGAGQTERLKSLQVSFYDPANQLIDTYNNVVDGVAGGTYFEFNFDPDSHKLMENIDLGGESAGEIYLKGKVGEEFALIEVDSTGKERVIDRSIGLAGSQ